MKSLILKIIRGSYPPPSSRYSYDLRNLIAGLLKKKPEERPTLSGILNKKFLRRAEDKRRATSRDVNNRDSSVDLAARRRRRGLAPPEAIYLRLKARGDRRIGLPSKRPVVNM